MISSGQWHKRVPKEKLKNLRFRRRLSKITRRGRKEREAILRACREDILFWINAYVFQYNPNAIGAASEEVGPFITWQFQEEAVFAILDAIEGRRDLLIEKSREMGASWLCLLVMTWLYLFHPWKKFLMISRDEHAVDKPGDSDSLFWKIDYVLSYLPDWMTEGVKRSKLAFNNKKTKSSITGQASTGKAGVGGRATAMFIDEFSMIKEDFEVLHRTSDTTGCRIFNGTHRGVGTAFHQLSQRVDMRKLRMHWSQHPDKRKGLYRYSEEKKRVESLDPDYEFPADYSFVLDGAPAGGPYPGLRSPWYDAQCARKGSARAVAMDLDIDSLGSVAQFFDPMTIRRLIATNACPPYWQGEVEADAVSGRALRLCASHEAQGHLSLWLRPKSEKEIPAAPYVIGADISAGTGATPSCLSIMNGRTGEKVGEYTHAHLDPKQFAVVATALGWLFSSEGGEPATLIWEQQGPGISFGNRVVELGYGRLYYRTTEVTELLGGKVTNRPGWVPNAENTRALLEDYRAALNSGAFVNRSEPAMLECLQFKYNDRGEVEHSQINCGKDDPTAARVNHGDHVIADALANKLGKDIGREYRKKEEEPTLAVGSLAWRRAIHAEAERSRSAW